MGTNDLKTTSIVIYTGARYSFIDEKLLLRDWIRSMRPPLVRTLTFAAANPISVYAIFLLNVWIGELPVRVSFGVLPNLVTRVLLVNTLINKIIKGTFPIENVSFQYSH